MKKPQKHKKRDGQRRHGGGAYQNVIQMPSRKRRIGELGIFERDYPPAHQRHKVIAELRSKADSNLGPDELWMPGEYLVYDGLMDEDDSLVNVGIQALTQGANHATPSAACMLDLAWIVVRPARPEQAIGHPKAPRLT
jgi:hypothetical protein